MSNIPQGYRLVGDQDEQLKHCRLKVYYNAELSKFVLDMDGQLFPPLSWAQMETMRNALEAVFQQGKSGIRYLA